MKIVFPEYKNETIKQALAVHEAMRTRGMRLSLGGENNRPLTTFEAVPADNLDAACELVQSGQADTLIAGIEYSSRDVILACKKHFGMAPLPPAIKVNHDPTISSILQDLPALELDQPDNSIKSKIKQKLHFKSNRTASVNSNPSPSIVKSSANSDLQDKKDEDTLKEKSAFHIPGTEPPKSPEPPKSDPTSPSEADTKATYSTFSGLAVMERNGETYLLADMAACKHPNERQLTEIIWQTYNSAKRILPTSPHIALLSFSTNGSGGKDDSIDLMKNVLAQFKNTNIAIDGEMQLDAAIVPEVGQTKFPDSQVAGFANVLIVPDLNTGNILYKACERLGNFTVAGPILQGFNHPVSDLSRGSTVADIILTIESLALLI